MTGAHEASAPSGAYDVAVHAQRNRRTGIAIALASSAAFATSGSFGRALLDTGWSPGAVIVARAGLAAVVLIVPAALAMRGRWALLRRNAAVVVAYGVLAVAGAQLAYFSAIQTLSVGVALLIEYMAPILVVGWMWMRTGRPPRRLTVIGTVLALVGLALVLDVFGGATVDATGVAWALVAMVGLAAFFVLAGHEGDEGLPPLALTGGGLVVGAAALALAGLIGVLPMDVASADVELGGAQFPWWVALLELAFVAGALAYVLAVLAVRRLGATVSAFVGLTEVLFASLFAWALLDQALDAAQVVGGVVVIAGIVAVRLGEQPERSATPAVDTSHPGHDRGAV
jgi:drug/metabolite transporter (DMT)-like permease